MFAHPTEANAQGVNRGDGEEEVPVGGVGRANEDGFGHVGQAAGDAPAKQSQNGDGQGAGYAVAAAGQRAGGGWRVVCVVIGEQVVCHDQLLSQGVWVDPKGLRKPLGSSPPVITRKAAKSGTKKPCVS